MRNPLDATMPIAVTIMAVASACRGPNGDAGSGSDAPNVTSGAPRPASAVTTSPLPATGCEWVPVSEVEKILGPFAGPPVGHEDSCRYPLPLDSATARTRAQYRAAMGPDASALRRMSLDKVEVVVVVDLRGDVSGERAGRVAGNMLGSMVANALGDTKLPADTSSARDEPPPDGWDVATSPAKHPDFVGRVGHVTVRVEENVPVAEAIPAEKKAALAALVRDRIPDVPFPIRRIDDTEPVGLPGGPDPCSLLTRDEAERALGRLVVPPYRSNEGGPLQDSQGSSCAYFTARHHVLVVTPSWSDGKQELALVRGTGDFVGALTGDREGAAADTLDGPWDDVALGLDGRLAFLRGDRLLQLAFVTSSTDQTGALSLARIALGRLAAAPTNRP